MEEDRENFVPEQPLEEAKAPTEERKRPVEEVKAPDETGAEGPSRTPRRGKFRLWWERHKPTKRRLIQVYVALLTNANIKGFATGQIYTGATKNVCVPGLNCYSCPGAVGACPLGSLQNAFAQSGTRTPYYVIGIILLLGLLFARTICGFFCPVGLLQDLTYKIKTPKLKKSRVTRVLSYFKYVLLAVLVVAIPLIFGVIRQTPVPAFCKYVCPAGTLGGAIGVIVHPSNAALVESLHGLFTWKFAVLVAIVVASVFIYRVFCRFLCPLGALYGFFNKFALLGIKLDKSKCTDCGLCVSRCKMDIRHVGDHECINCGECIDVCPAEAISWKGSKLFVHKNAVEPVPAPETEKPLSALLSVSAPVEGAVKDAAPVAAEKAGRKGKGFWLQVGAWCVALAVLLGALVYYNFIDKSDGKVYGNDVGDVCYDFTLSAYNGREDFTLSEHRGKIVLINFWGTWCGPCVTELPEFERIAEEYSEEVEVVAIHSSNITEGSGTMADVQAWLDKMEDKDGNRFWADWTITFVQDSGPRAKGEIYTELGGTGNVYPYTVIVDGEGVIRFKQVNSVSYDMLEQQVTAILNEQTGQ